MSAPRDQLPPGTVLDGKWRLESLLGEGGMGVVYGAVHTRNGSRVAVKLLHADVAKDATARERFLREGYAANKVEHPGVVKVLDDGTTAEGHTYLVMERLQGRLLDALAEQTAEILPVPELVRYALPLLDVIACAHARGIVHRDIKPENVFICHDGVVKVLDFGLARVREVANKQRLTAMGVPLGTPAFMPPEQAMARWDQVDARSDVYSIGATMFTLLTGRLVHEGRTVPEVLVNVSTRPASPIQSIAPHVPDSIAAIIDRALRFHPAERFASATEMLAALRNAVGAANGSSMPQVQPARSLVGIESIDGAPTRQYERQAPLGFAPGQSTYTNDSGAYGPALNADYLSDRRSADSARRTDAGLSSGTGSAAKTRGVVAAIAGVTLLGAAIGFAAYLMVDRQSGKYRQDEPSASSELASPGSAPVESVTVSVSSSPAPSASAAAGSSVSASVSASASSAPSARPRFKRPPVTVKPCKRDPFTMKCPCPRCD